MLEFETDRGNDDNQQPLLRFHSQKIEDNFDELSDEGSMLGSKPKVEQVHEHAFILTDIQSQLDLITQE